MKRRRRRRSKSSILSTRVDGVLRRVIDYPSALLEAEAEASYVAGFPEGVDVTQASYVAAEAEASYVAGFPAPLPLPPGPPVRLD